MSLAAIDDATIARHGLTREEYERVCAILGRPPNWTELGVFSVMWSEHCSYKSSRLHLAQFPTSGPQVIQGPGENAGVVDIGDGQAAVFKMESHNHPSFIEPYQGAATGVGGILRDVFTMGARPIALLDSLRFGSLETPRMRHLVDGVVRGIGDYGNCVGVPTVGGETSFAPAYDGNILVNVFCLGVVERDKLFLGTASGVGNPVIYVGSKTGRDGIHGATMASEEFGAESESKRPTVQVGDPFTEKLLLEACLELMRGDAVVGIQDMGAAGLTSSSVEMAGRAGNGIRLDLDKVPTREAGMSAYEILLSESQERMLIVAQRGREAEVLEVFARWDLDAVAIGEVTDDRTFRVWRNGIEVAAIPVAPIADQAPRYRRPAAPPEDLAARNRFDPGEFEDLAHANGALIAMLTSPNHCSKEWIWKQFDSTVRTDTVAGPGSDAAVMRLKGTTKGLAITSDVNPRYCVLDPFQGAAHAVAEAARNLAVSGARPLALTDCLNFGSPERPEIMWQFEQAVAGMAAACRALGIPVVSGNVSFYNETEGRAIDPTPTVGMLGLLGDISRRIPMGFRGPGDEIGLLGWNEPGLGGSEYHWMRSGRAEGPITKVNFEREGALIRCLLDLAGDGLLASAHDISEGGLALALAECAVGGNAGCEVSIPRAGRRDVALFGECGARAVVSARPRDAVAVAGLAARHGVPYARLGETQTGWLRLRCDGQTMLELPLAELSESWRGAFAGHMDPEKGAAP